MIILRKMAMMMTVKVMVLMRITMMTILVAGAITVFAPTDEAMARLDEATRAKVSKKR